MDQTEVGLQSVVKSLLDTVAPAIDPADHPAKEQLRLAVSYVDFVRQRLHMIHARERYELSHAARLGRDVLALDPPAALEPVVALRAALAAGDPLLANPAALTGDLRAAAIDVACAIACLVEELHERREPQARAVDQAILAASAEKLEFERLWYQPIGFDPSPPKDRRLEDFLK